MSKHNEDDFYGEDIEVEDVTQAPNVDFKTKAIQFLTSPLGKRVLILIGILSLIIVAIIVVFTVILFWPTSTSDDTDNYNTNSTCDSSFSYTDQISYQWRYGVMVDLGSSGSRIGIYQWTDVDIVQNAPTNGATYWYQEQRPGVSSYSPDAVAAANSLIPLLDYAVDRLACVNVNQTQVPIFLFATAGLRLLSPEDSQAILDSIRSLVKTQYSFQFELEWCRIISGTEEASFDWLSIQQLFLIHGDTSGGSKFAQNKELEFHQLIRKITSEEEYQTKGVVDLGGGSVEISFQPESVPEDPYDSLTFNALSFNGTQYSIYGYSHLPYGHNEARKLVENLLAANASGDSPVGNPCLLTGYNATVNTTASGAVDFYGTGDAVACADLVKQILPKDSCSFSSCSFNGVYQPEVGNSPFMALDNLARIVNFFDVPLNPVLVEIYNQTEVFCETPWEVAVVEYAGRPLDSLLLQNYCFEGIYGYELLTWGFGFASTSQQIVFVDQLYGVDVSWALGAMVNQVEELNL